MKAVIVYNAHSGKSKVKKKIEYIANYLGECYSQFDRFESSGIGSIKEFIILNGESYDYVIAAGGDGTIHEVINGVMRLEKKPTLAFIPAGTCNDAAKSLGFSKNLKKSLKIIKENVQAKVDVSCINDSYFMYGLAAGALSEISYQAPQKTKMVFGKLAYYFCVLKALKNTKPLNVKIETESFMDEGIYSVVLATNSRYLAGFRLKRKCRVFLNEGKLQVVLVNNRSKFRNLLLFGRLLILGEFKSRNVKFITASNITITSKQPIAYNTDGELFANETKVNVSVLHKVLNVVTSKKIINKYFK